MPIFQLIWAVPPNQAIVWRDIVGKTAQTLLHVPIYRLDRYLIFRLPTQAVYRNIVARTLSTNHVDFFITSFSY